MTIDGDHNRVSWRAHPAGEQRGRAVLALAVIAAFAFLAGQLMQSGWWILFAGAVPVLILNRFFLPSRFHVDGTGVRAEHPFTRRSLPWTEVRRFDHDERGGFVSPRPRPSRLDARRGVHLLFGDLTPERRDAVIARIRARLPAAAEVAEGGAAWAR